MAEALQKVKEDLGHDAIILSTRQVRSPGGTFGLFGKPMLEVTAALETEAQPEPRPQAAQKPRMAALGRPRGSGQYDDALSEVINKTRLETQQLLAPLQDDIHEMKEILGNVGDTQRSLLREERTLSSMRSELGELRQHLQMLSRQAMGGTPEDLPENLIVLYQQLLFGGMEEKFARRMVNEAAKNIPPKELEDFSYVKIFLARMMMKILKITGGITPEKGKLKTVALVGPTGVGKTTTLAKLASEQALKNNLKVGLITVDTFRIAAVEQLKVYGKIMDLPVTVARNGAELAETLETHRDFDCLFIDTAGRSQRDDRQIEELRELFGKAQGLELMLCLSATTKDSDITDTTRRFGELPLSSVCFTKLDESTTFGSLFNHAIRFKMPFGYLTTGQKVPEDIEVATRERMVDLMLDIAGA